MQYSVSPRCTFSSFGPKPSEKVITRTPFQRQSRKWPSSWMNTSTPSTNRNASNVVIASLILALAPARPRAAGPRIDPADVLERGRRFRGVRVHRLGDHLGNVRETEPAL